MSQKAITIRLGYVIRCGDTLVKIRKIKLVYPAGREGTANLEVSVATNRDADVSVRANEVDINGVPLKVAGVRVNSEDADLTYLYRLNLGVLEDSNAPASFVYFEISNLKCEEILNVTTSTMQVIISIHKILIYPLQSVRVIRYRVFVEHEDPFTARFTVEYTLVNNLPFPVRFLYLNLQRNIMGLEVRDDEDRVLRFLTRQELRKIFGEDVIDKQNEFYVVVDLAKELRPGEGKVLRFVSTEEITTKEMKYLLVIGLFPNLTESVVIRPPHGYKVILNSKGILVARNVSERTWESFKDRNQIRPLLFPTDCNTKSRVRLDQKFWLEWCVNPDTMEGNTGVELHFMLYEDNKSTAEEPLFKDPVEKPGIVITYTLEAQDKQLRDYSLTFFSVLAFSLFFQEFCYDTAAYLGRFCRLEIPFLPHGFADFFALTLVLGSVIGYLFAAFSGLVRGWKELLKSSGLVVVYTLTVIIVAISFGLSTSVLVVSKIEEVYIELEFAALVAIELVYSLAETAVRYRYRTVLLVLTILILASMLLLIPWAV